VLNRLSKNPDWVEYQNRMQKRAQVRSRRSYQHFMGQMQAYHPSRTDAWNQQVAGDQVGQNAQRAQSSSWRKTLTRLTDAVDPPTGNHFQVWTGPNAND